MSRGMPCRNRHGLTFGAAEHTVSASTEDVRSGSFFSAAGTARCAAPEDVAPETWIAASSAAVSAGNAEKDGAVENTDGSDGDEDSVPEDDEDESVDAVQGAAAGE